MKKLKTVFAIMFFAVALSTTATAQQYFTYDGDDFNVYLKTNSDNSQVLEVSFTDAAKSSWNQFSISDYYDVSDGFGYVVNDGAGQQFSIDYFGYGDYIVVRNEATGEEWTLNRRPE
ncbi:hypothetical protein QRD02_11265 [Aequorivita sp. SDUM287046]|uniref:Secreted protein n=1 Tax=Aequorivita aurantiaca TaxID=3053356 RepID=A0ABT8DHT4_9FLAO|nr:hypothetical protein [Aequorivita aurantiaca]MDN3724965.1 hypothetical protein [Aequorivita aurantiaca]